MENTELYLTRNCSDHPDFRITEFWMAAGLLYRNLTFHRSDKLYTSHKSSRKVLTIYRVSKAISTDRQRDMINKFRRKVEWDNLFLCICLSLS